MAVNTIADDQSLQDATGQAALARATRAPTIRPVVTQQAGNENAVIPSGMPGVPPVDRATITSAPDQSALIGQLNAIAKGGKARTFLEGAGTILAPTLLSAILTKEDSERKSGANLATLRALSEEEGLNISDDLFQSLADNPALAASIVPTLLAQNLKNQNIEKFEAKFDKEGRFQGQTSKKSGKFTEGKNKSIWRPLMKDGVQIGIVDQFGEEKLRPQPRLSFEQQKQLRIAGKPEVNVKVGGKKDLQRHGKAADDAAAFGGEIFNAGKAARVQAQELDLFETALDLGGKTGKSQEAADFLRNGVITMGLLTSEEALKLATLQDIIGAISQKQAFAEKPDATGSVSNFEQQIFRLAAIGMSKTVEGNRALIKFKRKILQRKIDDAKELASRMAEGEMGPDGKIDPTTVGLFPRDIRNTYMNKDPVFTKKDMEELLGFASSESSVRTAALLDSQYSGFDAAKMKTIDWQNLPKAQVDAYHRRTQALYNEFQLKKSQEGKQ